MDPALESRPCHAGVRDELRKRQAARQLDMVGRRESASAASQALAGRLQFWDDDKVPLQEYGILLEIEDGSLAMQAALHSAVIEEWIGGFTQIQKLGSASVAAASMSALTGILRV